MDTEHSKTVDPVFTSETSPLPELVAEKLTKTEVERVIKRKVYPYLTGGALALGVVVIIFLGALSDKIDSTEQRTTTRQIGDLYTELATIRQSLTALEVRSSAIAPDVLDKIVELNNRVRALEAGETAVLDGETGKRPDVAALAREADKLLQHDAAKHMSESLKAEPNKNITTETTLQAAVAPNPLPAALNELRQRILEGEPFGDELDAALALSTAAPAPEALLTALESRRENGVVLLSAQAETLPPLLRTALQNAAMPVAAHEPGKIGSTLTGALSTLVEVRTKKPAGDATVLRQIDTLELALRQNNRRSVAAALTALPEALRNDSSVAPAMVEARETLAILDGLETWRRSVRTAATPAKAP
jgi:hypothetical protein